MEILLNSYKNYTIIDWINLIEPKNRHGCFLILEKYKSRILKSKGSQTKHQYWEGVYIDHLIESMNIGMCFYSQMNEYRKLNFTISDVILILFLHDMEKPFKYIDPVKIFKSDVDKLEFIKSIATENKIELTENHLNALKYTHGEGSDYNPIDRIQLPLAAFVHICDVTSARIWFDYPKNKNNEN